MMAWDPVLRLSAMFKKIMEWRLSAMKCTKDNVLQMLDALQSGMESAQREKPDQVKLAYNAGYYDAIKNIRFIVSTVWEEA